MLVVDDKASMRDLLEAAFKDKGFSVTTASNGEDAIDLVGRQVFEVLITDLKMPGKDGIEVLKAARQISTDTQVIVVTAYGTVETAVEAMRLGARDFIGKPFKLAEIERKVEKILAEAQRNADAQAPPVFEETAEAQRAVARPPVRGLVGDSEQTRQLLTMIAKIGPSRSAVLISGPTGTGKELVAHAIHDASPRKSRPFVALNCAALAPGVLESELFGHEKGAFTGAVGRRIGRFEQAHTGTLFLDEVGEIDPNIQTKLLRVLQEGEFERVGGTDTIRVDVRVVAATNRDLRDAIQAGKFRDDFYYRLNVFSVRVEPLRNRRDDIPGLIDLFLKRFSDETGKQVSGVEDDVMNLFLRYPWPGNVRELENVLERAVVLTEDDTITHNEIPPEMFLMLEEGPSAGTQGPSAGTQGPPAGTQGPPAGTQALHPGTAPPALPDSSLLAQTEQLECDLIRAALERFHWNKTKAADHLGLKRTTLQYKIRRYGIE